MYVSEDTLREFLLDSGLVAKKEIDDAMKVAQAREQSLGDVLVSRGLLSEDALRRVQAYVLGIPFINLKDQRIPIEVLSLIPEPVARTHNVVAFKKGEGVLEVALLDITDLAALASTSSKTGLKILPRLTDTAGIKYMLLHYQKALRDAFGSTIAAEAAKARLTEEGEDLGEEELRQIAEDLPTVRIVDTLLRHAAVQNASDIHLEPLEEGVLVRYRINGHLHDAMTLHKAALPGIVARIKVLANLKLGEKHLPQDGRFLMETEAERISFRVSTLPTLFGEKVVLRLLRETGEGFTLETLGFHGEGLERVHRALEQSSGLILIAGPEDSGKTTTLYTLLDILNQPSVNISTIEDPIEYQMLRINQTQVHLESGFTLTAGLRALMRQDPDILMVGEIRDLETALLALHAAQTGRLVLSTVPAGSTIEAVEYFLDLGVDPLLLAANLRLVIGQRLVPRLSGEKESYTLGAPARTEIANPEAFKAAFAALQDEQLVKKGSTLDSLSFYRPKAETGGYKNFIGLQEVLTISPALREVILLDRNDVLLEQAKREGMLTLLEDGLYKAARGATSLEEVVRTISA
jgi:type IV pilus assembly protein PilB